MGRFKLMLLAVMAAAMAGCTSVPETVPDSPEQNGTRFPQVAEAFDRRDYAVIEPLLSGELREQLTPDNFTKLVDGLEQNGKLVKAEYLTQLRHPAAGSELWKLTFSRENAEGEAVVTDKLLRIMYGTLDGRPQIIGLMAQ
ncbi:MAG: hypothetical protein AB7F40_07690 [Victivallaceae bacterium]|nr:hypothetical protein [Victivallaceae bacterium]